MKRIILFCFIIIFPILFMSCDSKHTPKTSTVLSNIAYTNSNAEDCTVYLLENNIYVPYLVLTDDYYGNCLLLREKCLKTPMIYNPINIITPSYYENCLIDVFLNTDYFESLSDSVGNSLVTINLEITSQSSIGSCGDELTTIRRKVFLLSLYEVGISPNRIILSEGEKLEYFYKEERRVAMNDDGYKCPWYLRTPKTWGDDVIVFMGAGGAYRTSGIETIAGSTMNYIRPAFCMSKNTEIQAEIINGSNVYVIK